ncbi:restriction endonuclease [Enterococcus faecium]|uniref:restriction endonuclease n=1 Tax=Enterococcus TaxID=1350 RepID=UPI002599387E|nr:restriction endonuclease [uncultured Enterococcus sp.]
MSSVPFEIQQQAIECFGRCFHYKNTMASFLRSCEVPECLIEPLSDKPKFVWAKLIFEELNKSEEGKIVIKRILTEFYKMRNVPLEVEDRSRGVGALRKLKILLKENEIISVNNASNSYHQSKVENKQKEIQKKLETLNDIKDEFNKQFSSKNVYKRGYVLEKIISKLFKLNMITYHDSYRNSTNTQQVDGYFRFEGQDYLVETKWEKKAINSSEIASFKHKIDTKFHGTRGLFIAVNGFRPEVISDYSNREAKIIFLDGEELIYILENRISLEDAITYKLIQAAKTGNPHSPLRNLLF